MKLRVATTNWGKLREFRQMLEPLGVEVAGVDGVPGFHVEEDGETFADNAIKKARTLVELAGEAAVADDSGLVVDALGGAPGVRSARYAGASGPDQDAANRRKLLEAMRDVPDPERGARFVCALAFVQPTGETQVFTGELHGAIGREERGSGGFGYDAIFVLPSGKTVAELAPSEKHAISHRGQALRALLEWLEQRG